MYWIRNWYVHKKQQMLQNKLVQSVIQPPCQRCAQGLVNSDPLSTRDTIYVKVDKVGTNYNFDEPMLFRRDNIAKKINENDGGGLWKDLG